jgi:glycosyltransferase involved in cell wall biosynthesis
MTGKMKILILGTAWPYRGGLAAYNERLAEELQKETAVEIWTFTLQYPKFFFPGKSQYSTAPSPKLRIQRMINTVNPFNWWKVGRKIRKIAPDIIIVKYWLPLIGPCYGSILRLGKARNTTVISILDNVTPHEKRFGDIPFTRYFLKPIDAFIAMSQSVLDDLRSFEKKKPAIIIPHPIYDNYGTKIPKMAARENLQLQPNKKYILFFGIIRKYKGLDLLLNAMADERIKNLDINLIVAGEYYDDSTVYHQMIRELKIEERLHLHTTFIPDELVKNFFCASDLVVQPYRNATQSGITQIAYHFETPMIVTRVGGLTEMVPDNIVGFQCEPNPAEIALAIEKYYVNNREADMTAAIQIEKEKYSWQKLCNEIHSLANTK